MRKFIVALAVVLTVVAVSAGTLKWWVFNHPSKPEFLQATSGNGFGHWAVLLVSGDDRAHSGAPSAVFDNARHDLATAFAGIGFAPANMAQFAVAPDSNARPADPMAISMGLAGVTQKARAGCLIYFTSHGSPTGIIVGDTQMSPANVADLVNQDCGSRPAVIVMSACFSGQFVPALAADNRMVLTAARPDRTSFGCGENDHYTYFDDCFLRALPKAGDFPGLGDLVRQCVAFREQQMNATPPSEPQLSVGNGVLYTLGWK